MGDIYHHGIKGMHWGIRRTPEQLGHKTGSKRVGGKGKQEAHEDYKKVHTKKDISQMSDAELRARLNRLNMEQQYKKMNPSKLSQGWKALTGLLAAAGTLAGGVEALGKLAKKSKDVYSSLKNVLQFDFVLKDLDG